MRAGPSGAATNSGDFSAIAIADSTEHVTMTYFTNQTMSHLQDGGQFRLGKSGVSNLSLSCKNVVNNLIRQCFPDELVVSWCSIWGWNQREITYASSR